MRHFEGITSQEEVKARYKELAKKNHPDIGGSCEIMKEINAQYDQVLIIIYQKEGKSITEIEELLKDAKDVMKKLCEFIQRIDLNIELCGSWIWISGNTKAIKEELKISGFRWASKKLAWYWRKESELKRTHRTSWDMSVIRSKYGSETLKSHNRQCIA